MALHQLQEPRDALGARPSDGPIRFDAVTIGFHWTTVGLMVGMFVTALLHERAAGGAWAGLLLAAHRSLGLTLWVVAACRLAWRLRFAFLPPFPPRMSKGQQMAAKLTEFTLYALLLGQPLTGLAQSLALGRPFPLFGLQTPAVMATSETLTSLFHGIHAFSAWALFGLIGLHVLGALFHRFVLRDDVLQSMLPWKPAPPPTRCDPEDNRAAARELAFKTGG